MSTSLVLTVLLAYFLLLILVGFVTTRKINSEMFFTANRNSPWYLVAFGMIGTTLSGVTFISIPGEVGNTHWTYLTLVFGNCVGYIVIALVLLPLFYRQNLVSIYSWLGTRFGEKARLTGSFFFIVSQLVGASFRLFLVVGVLQLAFFDAIGVPFWLTVFITIVFVWIYTVRGGIKTIVWTDTLQTVFILISVGLTIVVVNKALDFNFFSAIAAIKESPLSRVFDFDWRSGQNTVKQFLAGVAITVCLNGLDQNMMQKNLTCRSLRDCKTNMFSFSFLFLVTNVLFLMLGVLLYIFAGNQGIQVEKSDELFPLIATGNYFPAIVGILFIIGLISSAYSAAGSALTALTTSFTVDILGTKGRTEEEIVKIRKRVHIGMAVIMGITIFVFNLLNNTSVIDAVYILASYTYGPILGLFAFGIFMKQQVRDKYIPLVAILSPILCFILQKNSEVWFNGYQFSYELLIFNALFTFIGLCLLIRKDKN